MQSMRPTTGSSTAAGTAGPMCRASISTCRSPTMRNSRGCMRPSGPCCPSCRHWPPVPPSPKDASPACWIPGWRHYRLHPIQVPALIGQVIPETVDSRAGYEARILQPMYRDIAPHDPEGLLQHEWLNCRGAIPRFDRSAIEIRVIGRAGVPAGRSGHRRRRDGRGRGAVCRALGIRRGLAKPAHGKPGEPFSVLSAGRRPSRRRSAGLSGSVRLPRITLYGSASSGPISSKPRWKRPGARHGKRPWMPFSIRARWRAASCARSAGLRWPRLQSVYRELCDCLVQGRMFTGIN